MAGVRVEFRNWGWRHAARKAWAVRGVDLVLEPGERVLLLGASGAGKSTLLAGVAGLLDPNRSGEQEGELLLDGVPARAARSLAVRSGRARTGLLLQDPQAQTVLARCGDDVAFGLENHAVPVGNIWPRVDFALKQVGFPYGREHPTSALSGGERQRLALAGAFALAPDLLLLDEPTAMLDPAGAELVRSAVSAALFDSAAGCLVVEHRVEPWLPLVDRVVVIGAGDAGVIADGHPDDVFASAAGELAEAGVWTPGLAASLSRSLARPSLWGPSQPGPSQSGETSGETLMTAEAIAVSRPADAGAGRRSGLREVLREVSFDLRRGRADCVTGPNGVGKSTLALAVSGLEPVAAGHLRATPALARGLGTDPSGWRAKELITRIGTVFQDPQHQFVAGTVREELEVGPCLIGPRFNGSDARPAPSVDELLERLRLRHLARANPFTLSGGEQRRLSVATVLATAPDLLVLDEPTFGQDARTWAELARMLNELLDAGAGMFVATHDLELVSALSGGHEGIRL